MDNVRIYLFGPIKSVTFSQRQAYNYMGGKYMSTGGVTNYVMWYSALVF
jgi:hypothetical protein